MSLLLLNANCHVAAVVVGAGACCRYVGTKISSSACATAACYTARCYCFVLLAVLLPVSVYHVAVLHTAMSNEQNMSRKTP